MGLLTVNLPCIGQLSTVINIWETLILLVVGYCGKLLFFNGIGFLIRRSDVRVVSGALYKTMGYRLFSIGYFRIVKIIDV